MFNNMAAIDAAALMVHTETALHQMLTTVAQQPRNIKYGVGPVFALRVSVPRMTETTEG